MVSFETLLDFFRFTHDAHKIERVARIPGEKRYATMVEHSWQLALFAWYIIENEKLQLNKEKVLMYALVHDLVETYAGDTYLYDPEGLKTKEIREHEALMRIKSERQDFEALGEYIAAYEKRADAESKFVYALDKLIDPINIYLEDGLLWQEKEITLAMIVEKKQGKVTMDPTVAALFAMVVAKLKEREPELFYHT